MDPPKPYARRSERERVLEAMLREAAERGYEGATVAGVAAAAGVSEQRLAEMFADKKACFLAAFDAAVDVLLAQVAAAYEAAGEPWADRIVIAVRTGLELLAAEGDISRMAVIEIGAVGDEARIRYRQAMLRWVPFVDEGRAASAKGEELPADTASFAVGAATSMIYDEIRAGRATELPRILPDVAFAMLTPYLGAEEAEAAMARVAAW